MANNHQSPSSLTAKELQRQYQIADLLTANQHTFIQMSSQEFIELILSIKKLQGLTMIAYGANVLINTNKLTLQFAHLLRQAVK